MNSDWVTIRPGLYARRARDGKYVIRQVENVRAGLRAKEEMRKATRKNLRLTETKGGSRRLIASMPPIFGAERDEKCKGDPELEEMFLRDHPEHLVVSRRAANLPAKKAYIFPKKMRKKR